jgi:hypothetical protein
MAKVWDCIQGSQKWLELRAGIPTSSDFDSIITPGGNSSKQASGYCNKLLAETMLGRPLAGLTMPWMQRGKQMEEEAVQYYELQRDIETVPVGFITTDDGRVGASPDRLVGDKGLLEIKCPTDETHTKYLAAHIDALLGEAGGVAEAYKVQCQGQLWVAEREWTDIESYFPGLPDAITRIYRDEEFIARMRALIYQFLEMFDERLEKLTSAGYVTERRPEREEQEITAFGLTEQDVVDYIASLKRDEEKPPWEGDTLFPMEPAPVYADPSDEPVLPKKRGRRKAQ